MARKKKNEYRERKLKNGEKRYDFDVSLGEDISGNRVRKTVTSKTITEGRDMVSALRINFNRHIKRNVKFKIAHKAYIKDLEKKVENNVLSPETLKNKIAYSTHYDYFEDYTLEEIDEEVLEFWKRTIEHLSGQTRNKYENELSIFLNWCIKKRMLSDNPFDHIDKTTYELEEMDHLTEEEFLDFISYVDHEMFKSLVTLMFYLGLRFEEAIAVSGTDEIQPHLLKLTHTRKGYYLTLSTRFKNKKSKRIVPMPVWLTLPKREGLLFNCFTTRDEIRNLLDYYIEKADFRHFTFHMLRHSYITMCLEKGMDPFEIARYVGHTTTYQIERRYGHLYKKRYHSASQQFGVKDPRK